MHNNANRRKWSKVAFVIKIADFIVERKLDYKAINALYYRLSKSTVLELEDNKVLCAALNDYIKREDYLHSPQNMN